MRKLIIYGIILMSMACSGDAEDPKEGIGCLTGIPKNATTTDRVMIRCCTYKEYTAGSNTSAGGISTFGNYTGHKWEKCNACK